jgi:hypothetical protein
VVPERIFCIFRQKNLGAEAIVYVRALKRFGHDSVHLRVEFHSKVARLRPSGNGMYLSPNLP